MTTHRLQGPAGTGGRDVSDGASHGMENGAGSRGGLPHRLITDEQDEVWIVGEIDGAGRSTPHGMSCLVFRRVRDVNGRWLEGPVMHGGLEDLDLRTLRDFLDLAQEAGVTRESVHGLDRLVGAVVPDIGGDPSGAEPGGEEPRAGERTGASAEAPTASASPVPGRRRYVFRGLARFRADGDRSRYSVTVMSGSSEVVGEAMSSSAGEPRVNLAARAALDAVERAEGGAVEVELERVRIIPGVVEPIAIVEVRGRKGGADAGLVGSCYAKTSEEETAAMAALDAVERWAAWVRPAGRAH